MTTAESESSASKKEYYDQAYFDSDEDNDNDDSSMSVDKPASKDRQKKREVIDNDELLYNPEEDDTNEDWVAEQLRAIAPSEKGRKSKRSMAKTDAILTCPLCFTPVCLSCQRHDLYPNQYRAMFVTNCRPNFAERFRYKEPKEEGGNGDDVYYPVNCDICKTHIAMFDHEESNMVNVFGSRSLRRLLFFCIMSWKGLQKAVSRLPHQIMSKKGDVTRDPEYMELEKQFKLLSQNAQRLQTDAETYRDGVAAMLNHQASFSEYLSILYQPLDAELEDGVVRRRNNQTSAKAVQAVQDYATIMSYSRDEIMPCLDVIDAHIVSRLIEFREILKTVDKTMIKRNHKMLDYDRFRTNLAKLKGKAEKTISEEKQIYKLESQLDIATQDYEYLNGIIKEELPRIIQLRTSLVDPMFQEFYFLQCQIYGMLLARMQEVISTNGLHFETLTMGVEEGFNERLNKFNARTELEESGLLKQGGRAWLGASAAKSSKLPLKERAQIRREENAKAAASSSGMGGYGSDSPPPPAYGTNQSHEVVDSTPYQADSKQSNSYTNNAYSPPQTGSPGRTYVRALYDYNAQAEGDLTFAKDDLIEVIQKTADVNDWWTGSLNGATGVFPGNYVTEA